MNTSTEPGSAGRRGRWFEPAGIGQISPGGKLITYFLLLLWAFVVLFPIYWLLITAFKLPPDVNNGPTYIPWVDFQPALHAWRNIFVEDFADTFHSYSNSIIISFFSTILCVMVGSLAAYALVRIQYKPRFGSIVLFVLSFAGAFIAIGQWGVDWRFGVAAGLAIFYLLWRATVRGHLSDRQMSLALGVLLVVAASAFFAANLSTEFAKYGRPGAIILLLLAIGWSTAHWLKRSIGNADILFWIISQRILPPVVVVLPIYIMFQRIGLLDTHLALILAYTVINLPIVVWLMHDFISTIPLDLEESAQLDGASRLQIFWEIVLPLSRPGLAATTLLTLILSWNEYLLATFLSTSRAQTMPLMVAAQITQERGIYWWNMAVVIIVMIIPVVAMAFVLQRFIAKGVLLGAVKG
jgi:multiple sugar transport system permease protein